MEQIGIRTDNLSQQNFGMTARSGRIGGLLLLAIPLVLMLLVFLLKMGSGPLVAARSALHSLYVLLLGYVLVAGLARCGQLAISALRTRTHTLGRQLALGWPLPASERVPPLSILVWVHNQAPGLTDHLERLLKLDYPNFEIIVINDGSTDSTREILHSAFALQPLNRIFRRALPTLSNGTLFLSSQYPNLIVVDKTWSGRGDSLNFGLNLAKYPFVCTVDVGLILQPQGLARLAKGFIEDPSNTIAVSSIAGFSDEVQLPENRTVGSISVVQPARSARALGLLDAAAQAKEGATLVENLQRVDRLGAFHSSWLARTCLGSAPIAGGIIRMFKKSEAMAVGGFDPLVEAESLKILLHMQTRRTESRPQRVVFLPDVIAATPMYDDLDWLGKQQRSWQQQAMNAVLSFWKIALGPFPNPFSFLAFPTFLLIDVLGPVIELLAGVTVLFSFLVGAVELEELQLFILALLGFGLFQSVGSVLSEEYSQRTLRAPRELLQLLIASLLHVLGYRQLSAFWKLRGVLDFIRNKN
ncbi:MAG: glycosyltransferase family 2 protein [Blastocatellia bacterium]|nr:glycosyltransferase family 2 protein [Blastocatellia bacterium]